MCRKFSTLIKDNLLISIQLKLLKVLITFSKNVSLWLEKIDFQYKLMTMQPCCSVVWFAQHFAQEKLLKNFDYLQKRSSGLLEKLRQDFNKLKLSLVRWLVHWL